MKETLALAVAIFLAACAPGETTAASAGSQNPSKTSPGHHSDGLVRIVSAYSVEETVTRLEAALAARNVNVMAKIDHAANAAGADLALEPTVLVIFGNPAAGTLLMQASRSAAIDLPMKALIYEKDGAVMYEYNAVGYIAARHGVPADLPVIKKIEDLLGAVAAEATGVQ